MPKRFPFTKGAIEARETDSKRREAEDFYAECIRLKLKDLN